MATYLWVGLGSSGSWASPANWADAITGQTPAGPPGSGDYALVDLAVAITGTGAADTTAFDAAVTLSGMLTAGTLAVPAPVSGSAQYSLTLAGAGASIDVTSNLAVGAGSLLDVDGGAVTGPAAGKVGFQDFGTVSVEGGGSIDSALLNVFGSLLVEGGTVTAQTLEVGAFAGTPGSLDLAAGSSIADIFAILGITGSDVATVTIAGADRTSQSLTVASAGTVTLTVAAGGTVEATADATFGAAGTANVAVAAGGSLSVGGTLDIAAQAGASGTLSLLGQGTSGDLVVGDAGLAQLTLNAGGALDITGTLDAGALTSGGASLEIAGANARLSIGQSATIGDAGAANLAISAGGGVSVSGSLDAAAASGSTATIDVSGSDAVLNANDATFGDGGTATATVGDTASITVGGVLALGLAQTGQGTLDIEGGLVRVTGDMDLGDAGGGNVTLGANGTLTVAGTLSEGVQANSSGSLLVDDATAQLTLSDWIIGVAGTHDDTISAAASLSLAGALTLGSAAGGDGALTLDGGASLAPGAGVTVGGAGDGSIDLSAGATLDGAAGAIVLGATAGGQGTITLGGTAAEATASDLAVGGGGTGVVTVAADTTLSVSGDVTLGQTAGGTGTITVAGSGDFSTGGSLTVGAAGAGLLDVDAGSLTVSGAFIVADAKGGSGDVSFAQATLSLGTLTVGDAGAGTFSANTSANVTATQIVLGSAASGSGTFDLDGSASEVQAGSVLVGNDGTGALQVTNGATLQVSGLASMGQGGGLTPQGATIASNATWTIGGALQVGEAASAGLTIDTGGQVAAASVVLGDQKGASGTLTASGSATLASALGFGTLLQVGHFGSGELVLANGAQAGVGTTGTVEIAAGTSSDGGVTLTDAGTTLQAQLLAVGGSAVAPGGAGTLSIGTGAQVLAATATVWGGGTAALAGGMLTADAIAVLGSISGFGTLGGTVTDSGRISAGGGTLAVAGFVAGGGTLSVASGADLWLQAGAAASLKLAMATSGATLQLGALAATHAAVTGFAVGDTILVDGVTADGGTFLGGTLTLTHGATPVGTLALSGLAASAKFTVATVAGEATIAEAPPCFAAGTRIATEHGEVPVEHLQVGQRVRTRRGGYRRIVWLGHRHLACARHPRPHDVLPVRVRRGAFGPGVPARDLLLSPDHAVLAGGALIPVRYLVNGATIRQESVAAVTYWHVELDRHDVLLAEGLLCESYLDTGNRAAFANAAGPVPLHPEFSRAVWQARGCAPLVLDGPRVAVARKRLLRRAATLGHALTDDSDLVLEVASETLARARGRRWHVLLPPGTQEVRLRSRIWVPCETRPSDSDTRRLGVAIANLALDGRPVPLGDPRLSAGWHAPEPDWRWTDGDACLRTEGAFRVEFDLVMTGTYWRNLEKAA